MFFARNKNRFVSLLSKLLKIEHVLEKIDATSVSRCKHFDIF